MKSGLIVSIAAAMALGLGPSALASPSDPSGIVIQAPPPSNAPAADALTSPPTGPIHMTVGDVDMVAAAPDGYCDPIGELSVLHGAMNSWAERAHLSLGAVWVKCDFHAGQSGAIKLALIAAKGDGPRIPYSRKVVIKSVVDTLPTAMGKAVIAQSMAQGNDAAEDPGASTKLKGQPQIVGVDDDAVYILADADRTSQTGQLPFTVIEALTLIKGRIAVFAFAVVHGSDQDKAELVAAAKREVKLFVAMNGG